jgi:hypothetical protein
MKIGEEIKGEHMTEIEYIEKLEEAMILNLKRLDNEQITSEICPSDIFEIWSDEDCTLGVDCADCYAEAFLNRREGNLADM